MTPSEDNDTGIEVTISRTRMRVPVIRNEENTRRIVEDINRRMEQIEEDATHINSMVFALRTAFDLAVELERCQESWEQETAEITHALEKLAAAIEALILPHRDQKT